jgi:hypothetical protein
LEGVGKRRCVADNNPLPVKKFLPMIGKYRHLNQSEADVIFPLTGRIPNINK